MRWIWILFSLLFWTGLASSQEVEDPERARVAETLQEVAISGEFESAGEFLQTWIATVSAEFGSEHPQVKDALFFAGKTLFERGHYADAFQVFEQLVDLSTRLSGRQSVETLTFLGWLAGMHGKLGQFPEAQKIEEEILEAQKSTLGDEHPNTLTAKANLAATLQARGDLAGAQQREEEVLQARQSVLGDEHPDTLTAKANLAATLQARGDLAGALQRYEEVLEALQRILGDEHPTTLTAKANLAGTLYARGDLAGALQRYEEVLEALQRILGDEHPTTLTAKANLAATLQARGDLAGAQQRKEEVLQARQSVLGDEHPDTLTAKANLAATLQARGDLAGAQQRYEEVLEALQRILGGEHPDTLTAKVNLAATLYDRGDLAGAQQREEEVLQARQRILGDEHPDTLTAKANLAGTLQARGDLAGAQQRQEEVLQARQRILGDEHPDTLSAKANLAATLHARGDLAGAQQREEEVLHTLQRVLGDEHPSTLTAKANLAGTLQARGDLAGAQQRQEEVLQARQRILGDEHPDTLAAKANLAGAFYDRGNLAGAQQRYEEVLQALQRILGDEHPDTLTANNNLAATLRARGDLAGAQQRYEEVLHTRHRILGDGHPDLWSSMHNLATTLRAKGDLEGASRLFEQLICLRRQALGPDHQPNTEEEANNYFFLGATRRELGQLVQALSAYRLGLDALEAQTLRADHSEEVQHQFRDKYSSGYSDAIAVSLNLKRPNDAFQILERYRTQSLLSLLRWSHPDLNNSVPPEIRQELDEIAAAYDRLTRQIDRLFPTVDPALLEEQKQLRRRRDVLQGRVIAQRRAETEPFQPLELEAIRQHLDPGTLLLAYSIGGDASYLFAIDHKDLLEVHPVEAETLKLWIQIGDLRKLNQSPSSSDPKKRPKTVEARQALEDHARQRQGLATWLYKKLLGPVAQRIEEAERVVILPDGPLHYLSFATLGRPLDDASKDWQYLAEWRPMHTVQSATVYAELIGKRRPTDTVAETNLATQPLDWVGFGDPEYPVKVPKEDRDSDDPVATRLHDTEARGIWDGLRELPYTQREVQGIVRQFPEGQAKVFTEKDATEDAARKILQNTRIVHFATHGLADPDYPMDSFLALSLLDGDDLEHNGLLQAWEIVDHLKLDADLVVLSACVTAFGPERGGEGLISLSRAFQIAGARSVLASLWAVNDISTSELMIRFYKHLRAGESKDRALQLAQQELIAGPIEVTLEDGTVVERDFSAPYYWAAFQLIGDWK